jgi:hypothetical protein
MRNPQFTVVANKQDKRGTASASTIGKRFKLARKIGVYDAIVTSPEGDICRHRWRSRTLQQDLGKEA